MSLPVSPKAWEADSARLDKAVEPVLAMRGKLDSAGAVARSAEED
jgi:hypothetical protein